MPLRVLVVSHPAVATAYRRKFDLIADAPDIDLRLVVPVAWPEESRHVVFDSDTAPGWVSALPIAFEGYYSRFFYKHGLGAVFRSFRPHLVHLEEEPFSVCAAQVLWQMARLAPSAKLIFRTSLSTEIRIKPLARPLLKTIERRVFRRASCAFVLSDAAGDLLRMRGYEQEIRAFPNGVDVRVFHPSDPAERSVTRSELCLGDDFSIAYVGRLIPVKGIDTLLEATALLSDARVVVIGSGDDEERLLSLSRRLGLDQRVTFTGALPPHDVARIVASVDALVLPSRTSTEWVEFFGRSLIEAMACGVPVVGADSGQIPTTIGDAGLTFPSGDARALADTVERLRADPDLRLRLVQRGHARVESEFSWEAIARRTLDAYREVADAPR